VETATSIRKVFAVWNDGRSENEPNSITLCYKNTLLLLKTEKEVTKIS